MIKNTTKHSCNYLSEITFSINFYYKSLFIIHFSIPDKNNYIFLKGSIFLLKEGRRSVRGVDRVLRKRKVRAAAEIEMATTLVKTVFASIKEKGLLTFIRDIKHEGYL